MNSKKFLLFAIWVVITFLVLAACNSGLNAPSTITAILGFLGIAVWIVISIKTQFFTNWTNIKIFKNKKK